MDAIETSAQLEAIGMIGGLTHIATAEYYKVINNGVRKQLRGSRTAKTFMSSLDLAVCEHFVSNSQCTGSSCGIASTS